MSRMEEPEARKVPENYVDFLRQNPDVVSQTVEGVSVDIFPGVFRPATDAYLLAANLSQYIEDKDMRRVLDTTSGSGVLAVLAGSYGARGVAVDINPVAVENMTHNFQSTGVLFKALKSDVFENVLPQEFDLIVATPPYLDGEINDPLDYAVHGTSHFVDGLLQNAHSYLAENGKMLVTYARWGLVDEFEQKLIDNNWKSKIVDSKSSADGERQYDLYEISAPRQYPLSWLRRESGI